KAPGRRAPVALALEPHDARRAEGAGDAERASRQPAPRAVARPRTDAELSKSPGQPLSRPFTITLALAKSIWPGCASFSALTTLPMSLTLVAPVAAMAAFAAA